MLDRLLLPALAGGALIGTALLRAAGAPVAWACVSVPVGALAATAAILERLRPERPDYRQLDLPLRVETAHFFLNYQFGYALALALCTALGSQLEASRVPALWPARLPIGVQIVLAILATEGISYWQHRLFHRVPRLWRFHALHHRGERLNLVRAGRFHFVDVGAGALFLFVPLVLLRAPEGILVWTAATQGAFGVLQHANIRMRTPSWLDGVICTPAVHRYHHSRIAGESDANFGTTVMLFDRLFRTYVRPAAPGPEAVGVENDPLPSGFWRQVVGPFQGA